MGGRGRKGGREKGKFVVRERMKGEGEGEVILDIEWNPQDPRYLVLPLHVLIVKCWLK